MSPTWTRNCPAHLRGKRSQTGITHLTEERTAILRGNSLYRPPDNIRFLCRFSCKVVCHINGSKASWPRADTSWLLFFWDHAVLCSKLCLTLGIFILQEAVGSILRTNTKQGDSAPLCIHRHHICPAPPRRKTNKQLTLPKAKTGATQTLDQRNQAQEFMRHTTSDTSSPTLHKEEDT